MGELRVLIPAAGRGSRAGLSYPKTLYPIDGVPILHRLLSDLSIYDATPTVVVSPSGEPLIRASLHQAGLNAHLIIQPEPRGMGDAVLRFVESPDAADTRHILLAWGDLASLQPITISTLVEAHLNSRSDFTFATKVVDNAYTHVKRDLAGTVVSVSESRQIDGLVPPAGERDIGLFVFQMRPVFDTLKKDLHGKFGVVTGEHGFLYLIEHLVRQGSKVIGLPIATYADLVSLNSVADLCSLPNES